MSEISEAKDWEDGWAAKPTKGGELVTKPRPENDIDIADFIPQSREPASHVAKGLGDVATLLYLPKRWD